MARTKLADVRKNVQNSKIAKSKLKSAPRKRDASASRSAAKSRSSSAPKSSNKKSQKVQIQTKSATRVPSVSHKVPRKSAGVVDGGKKKHRFRPGTAARREIIRLQKKSDINLIPKAPFYRILRQLISEIDPNVKFGLKAFIALREATQNYLEKLSHDCNLIAKRRTVSANDFKLAQIIRGEDIAPVSNTAL